MQPISSFPNYVAFSFGYLQQFSAPLLGFFLANRSSGYFDQIVQICRHRNADAIRNLAAKK
jgi:hypothetical protein